MHAATCRSNEAATLRGARIVYKTFGALSPRNNAIVYPTSYSAQHGDIEWLVSPEHCLDPTRYFIVILNMFGNGLSSSPSNTPGYPDVTTYVNVMQQRRLMSELFGVRLLKKMMAWETLNGARILGIDAETGSVAAGKTADLMIVRGDPVATPSAIYDVVTVFRDGVGFDSARLRDAAKGRVGID